MLSTLVRASTMSAWVFRVDAVLARWRRIWPLSVAVDRGRCEWISAGVRPGMVFSSVLFSRARRRVVAGGEHRSWCTYRAYSAAEEVAMKFAANSMGGGAVVGRWVVP